MDTYGIKVRDVMTSPAITIAPETPFTEVVAALLHYEVSGMPVVDADNRLLGVVSEADLVAKEGYGFRRRRPLALVGDFLRGHDPQWVRKASARTARELMTSAPTTVSPDTDIAIAARSMIEWHHKRLPVVEDGRVVGVVTRHDLLKPFHRTDAELDTELTALLADPLRVPDSHHAQAHAHGGVVTLEGEVEYPVDAAVLDAAIGRVPGVVAVDNRLAARFPQPVPMKQWP